MDRAAQAYDAIGRLGLSVERDVALRDFTTFRIGGAAEVLVVVDCADRMVEVLRIAREAGLPVHCLGGGSNVLVSDEGVPGITVINRIAHVRHDGAVIHAGGGATWDDLVEDAVERGLSGLAAMSGIPGSVGGAVYGNAGAYGESVSNALVSATVVDPDGATGTRARDDLGFAYRHSNLKRTGEVVLEVTFRLREGDRGRLREQRETTLRTRSAKLPRPSEATAGSFFKNIAEAEERRRLIAMLDLPEDGRRIAAGLLLDRVGARRMRVGDAVVFERHANIIVNEGAATAADVIELSRRMRALVRDAFGVVLQREVIWIGRSPCGEGATSTCGALEAG